MTARRADLKSRMTTAATRRAEPDAPAAGKSAIRTDPVRVTLNIPPELYRQLRKWMDAAADQLGVPQVNVQDTLRAMIRESVLEPFAGEAVIRRLREDKAG